MTRINRREVIAAGAATAVGAAFSPFNVVRSQAKLRKMDIFLGTTPQFSNVIVGLVKGFYEQAGLPAEITYFTSGTAATQAFRTGRGDIVVCGDLPALRLWTAGDGFGISPQAHYDLGVIVARDAIKSPADMRGKKIGVLLGSTSEYFIGKYLAKGGMTMKDIDVVNLTPAEMVTGLDRGDIEGFVLWQPFGWKAVETIKGVHIVTDAGPYFQEWEMITTRKDYASSHGPELIAFIKGLDAAGKWIPGHVDEASQVVAEALRTKDLELVKRMIAQINWNLTYTPKFRTDMELLAAFIKAKIDWNTMFDSQYLRAANRSLVA